MNRILHFRTMLFLFVGFFANAQTIVWTGVASSDFFNEANWKDSVTNVIPANNSINPGANITLALQINTTATITTSGSGAIQFSTGSLAIGSANLTAVSLSGGTVTINEGGYVNLSSATPLLNNVQINFTSGIGWIQTTNYTGNDVLINNMGQLKVNAVAATYQTNLRLDHYYLNGCVIRANLAATTPLTVYDGINSLGNSALVTVNTLHSGGAIAGSMNNKIKSFVLKKGFMATFAIENDGTGKSKNYIASEADLVINTLPVALRNSISFIRVIPWNWVTKKGITDTDQILDATWLYRWNNSLNTTIDWEYTPMQWGYSNNVDNTSTYAGKYNSTHVLAFNEPDYCYGQSGQWPGGVNGANQYKLCNVDVAVADYKKLMKTGMRLVSPACREEGALNNGWLEQFITKATAQDIRIDAIAVHWYDWGSDPEATPTATAAQIFARFQSYITTVYGVHNLPIWITEFNANPARSYAINAAFINLALPWLETLSYVERYAWFPNNIGTDYNILTAGATPQDPLVDTGTISAVGTNYMNHVSSKSIPGTTVNANNNLNLTTCLNCN